MQIKAAIGSFFVEFSKFEVNCLGIALRALSKDSVFVEQAEKLLGLEARLTLLERMAFARGVSAKLMTELGDLLSRTRRLLEQRDDVARALVALEAGRPAGATFRIAQEIKPLRKRGADFKRLTEITMLRTPSLSQIEAHAMEAIELQTDLSALAAKLDSYFSCQPDVPAQSDSL